MYSEFIVTTEEHAKMREEKKVTHSQNREITHTTFIKKKIEEN